MSRFLSISVITACLSVIAVAEEVTGSWGFDQRVRNENWNNLFDFSGSRDDQQNQIRYRTRLWVRFPVNSGIDLFAGINQETNQVISPHRPWRFDEVVIENLYLDFKRLFLPGLSLRVGRQNLTKGEGLVLLEGGPFDGSRAIYFNAVNLAYTRRKNTIEFLAISDPATDRYLPRLHDRCKPLVEWDEKAAGAYFTGQGIPGTVMEAYSLWED